MGRSIVLLLLILFIAGSMTACGRQESPADAPEDITAGPSGLESGLSFKDQDTAIQAYRNLQAYFGWVDDETIGNMPEDYGGCYIDDNNVLTVCVVSPDEESIALYKEACAEPINIKSVEFSMLELREAYETVNRYRSEGKLGLLGGGLRETENRVLLIMPDEEAAGIARQLLAGHPCVEISVADGSLRPSKYGDRSEGEGVEIVPEFPVYDPDIDVIRFIIYNNTDTSKLYGLAYTVEVKADGQWYEIPFKPGTAWNSMAYILSANDYAFGGINLTILNYDFIPGDYRVVIEMNNKAYMGEFRLGESRVTAETPFGFARLEGIPHDYHMNDALEDGCVVVPYDRGTYDLVEEFLAKVYKGVPAMLRIASITDEGGVIFEDIEYKRAECGSLAFFYTYDSTRDNFGAGVVEKEVYSFLTYTVRTNDRGIDILYLELSNSREYPESEPPGRLVFRDFMSERYDELIDIFGKIEEMYETAPGVRYRLYSPDGKYSVSCLDAPLELWVEGNGRSEMMQVPADMAEKVTGIYWLGENKVQLVGVKDGKEDQNIAVLNLETREFD